MSRVELPDAQWAELHPPKKVKERARRAYIRSVAEFQRSRAGVADDSSFGGEQQSQWDTTLDLLIVCLVASWSFEQPVTVEALSDFGVDTFDALKKACLALAREILPDLSDAAPADERGELNG